MSIKLMSIVYESALEKAEKAIALSYADHADDTGRNIYPSVAYTAWKTGYSERSVQRATQSLIEKGILRDDGNGPNGTNRYRLITTNLPERQPFRGGDTVSGGGDILTGGGDTMTPGGVTPCQGGGDTVSPKPSVNHQKEPLVEEATTPAHPLIVAFTEKTAFFSPDSHSHEYRDDWQKPAERLLKVAGGDLQKAIGAVNAAIDLLREKRYTIRNFSSIYKTAVTHLTQPAANTTGKLPRSLKPAFDAWISGQSDGRDLPAETLALIRKHGESTMKRKPQGYYDKEFV